MEAEGKRERERALWFVSLAGWQNCVECNREGKEKWSRAQEREEGGNIDDRRGERGLLNEPGWQGLPLIHFPFPTITILRFSLPPFSITVQPWATCQLYLSAVSGSTEGLKSRWVVALYILTQTPAPEAIYTGHANNETYKSFRHIQARLHTHSHTRWHVHTKTHAHTTVERATGCLCQPHFTVAYHGQAYQACGQPLLMPWVNTSTSATWSCAHTLPECHPTLKPSHIQTVINGVWALDMTASLSLCDKEPHTASLFPFRPFLCPFFFTDSGLLSSHLGILLGNTTLA